MARQYSPAFARLWARYPKKDEKWASAKEYVKAERDGALPPEDELFRALEWAVSVQWAGRERDKIMSLRRWIHNRGWQDAPGSPVERAAESSPHGYPPGMAWPIYSAMVKAKELGLDPLPLKAASTPDQLDHLFRGLAGHPFYLTYFPHIMKETP